MLALTLYLIVLAALLVVMWIRIGAWEDAQDELERRRNRHT